MEEATSAFEVAKKVNILDAIMWLKSAWDEVQPASIQKCFAKCGFSEQLLQCHENVTVPGKRDHFRNFFKIELLLQQERVGFELQNALHI